MSDIKSDHPQRIGRYVIQREIGRGGMAVVYLAFDPHFERQVAIKVMPRELLIDPSFLARFKREAKIIASLEHPAIVPVYDYGEEQGQPYLVMRYMPGGSLEDRLENGQLSLLEVCRLFERLAPALDEAHSHGIVHRDLKPGNILFDQRGEAYLADFGIVKLAQATTTLTIGTIIGTPAYMSPEQGLGKKDIDGRADIYSLGAILFHLLTGSVPYEAETPTGQIMMHITQPVPDILAARPDLPPQIQTIINHAMAKSREERYNNVTELAKALVGLAAEQGEPEKPEAQSKKGVEKTPSSPTADVDRTLMKAFLTEHPQETDLSSKKEDLEPGGKRMTPAISATPAAGITPMQMKALPTYGIGLLFGTAWIFISFLSQSSSFLSDFWRVLPIVGLWSVITRRRWVLLVAFSFPFLIGFILQAIGVFR